MVSSQTDHHRTALQGTADDTDWSTRLTPEQYRITRQGGTERPFTGPWLNNHKKGRYTCICCATPLFSSSSKFESGTGWPSFYDAIDKNAVSTHHDRSFFMVRTEIRCAACEAHLGHVFPDGPAPTGLRYCTNGTALGFVEDDSAT